MRRALITLAATVSALSLAACGGGGSGEPDSTLPEVSGSFGEQPTLTWSGAEPSADLVVDVLSEGGGDEVAAGDFVVANYIGQVWDAEAPFNDSWATGGPMGFSLNQVIDGWKEGLPGTTEGSRVLLSIPADKAYGDSPPDGSGIAAGDTLAFVIDVVASYGEDAFYGDPGAADTGALADLPVTVTGAMGEQPSVTIDGGAAEPTENALTVINEGSGEPVGESGSVVVSFSVTAWDGSDGGSTGAQGAPQVIPLGNGSVFDQLVGVPVGSRAVALFPTTDQMQAFAAVIDVVGYIPANS